MKIFLDLDKYVGNVPSPVIPLGNFDGIHMGHQEIFRVLRREAADCGGTTIVVTFHPHPLKVLCPERSPRLITSFTEKIELIRSCGIDILVCVAFTREFAKWEPDRFVDEILAKKLAVSKVLVGEDFRFGKDRKGDLIYLKKAGIRHGFSVRRIKPVKITGREASSTRIRYCIQKGLIRESSALLGRPYQISGVVQHGDQRGRELGFPTANIQSEAELLPPNGAYAVWVTLGNRTIPGIANLGVRPTFSGDRLCIEVHLFDFNEDIYTETLKIHFVEWLREERAFPGVRELVQQIKNDAGKAREVLRDSQILSQTLAEKNPPSRFLDHLER